jgi:hypothetical protein
VLFKGTTPLALSAADSQGFATPGKKAVPDGPTTVSSGGVGTPRLWTVSFAPTARGSRFRRRWCSGAVPIGRSGRNSRGVDILVAMPGRLLDLIDTRSLSCRAWMSLF